MVSAGGLTAAVFSALLNGSFGLFGKVSSVQRANVPAIVFNFWLSVGLVLSSLFTLIAKPLAFTPWGLLSGVLFVLSTACTFFAINRLGLSSAAGIWCGTAILVSFVYAVRFQGDVIKNGGLAAGGIAALVAGLALIGFNGAMAARHRKSEGAGARGREVEGDEEAGEPSSRGEEEAAGPEEKLAGGGGPDQGTRAPATLGRSVYYAVGLLLAVATGFFGGLVLAPLGRTGLGLNYVPSMAVGVIISSPIITAALLLVARQPFHFFPRQAALPGILAGCLWNGGNILSIVATKDPQVGLAIAYPIMQCSLLVAGIWGITLFGELRGVREQSPFWVGGAIVVAGAAVLAAAK